MGTGILFCILFQFRFCIWVLNFFVSFWFSLGFHRFFDMQRKRSSAKTYHKSFWFSFFPNTSRGDIFKWPRANRGASVLFANIPPPVPSCHGPTSMAIASSCRVFLDTIHQDCLPSVVGGFQCQLLRYHYTTDMLPTLQQCKYDTITMYFLFALFYSFVSFFLSLLRLPYFCFSFFCVSTGVQFVLRAKIKIENQNSSTVFV